MHLIKRYMTLSILFLIGIGVQAQSPHYLPGTRGHEISDRWDVLYWKKLGTSYTSFGNIGRASIVSKSTTGTSLKSTWVKPDDMSEEDYNLMLYGGYKNDSTEVQGIVRNHMMVNAFHEHSSLDQADLHYIYNDNNEYSDDYLGSGGLYVAKRKQYDDDGIFYRYADEEEQEEVNYVEQKERSGILGTFYKTPANFYKVDVDGFYLSANPILHLSYGQARDDANTIFQNVRGAELRGLIDKKVYFYTNILETQARFNNFLERRIQRFRAIPGQGFYKTYESGVIESLKGWDFLNSQAYIGANVSKSIAIELGHGRHFIGNGIRSLILSDYANNYFYLKFNTQVWKFRYQNIFAELAPISDRFMPGNNLLPKKYMANHYLSFSPRDNMEIGIFETVVFSRQDQFELQYLNPIILYRTVEQFLDSPDNVLIGLTGKWNIVSGVQLYGQLILDEFKLSEITNGNGWWANKYGLQTGVKYYNVANIDHLDVQVEYNTVRPYTYAHRDTLDGFPNQNVSSYTHYNQPLAHPLGANFTELLFEVRYRPTDRLYFKGRAVMAQYGQDPSGQNYGGNPLLPLESRQADYGNFTGQGIETDITLFSLDASYEFYHNYYVDLRYLRRNEDAADDDLDLSTNYLGLALRVNLGMTTRDY